MMNRKNKLLWLLWFLLVFGVGSLFLYQAFHTEVSRMDLILYIIVSSLFPLSRYQVKRKIEKGKKEFGITGDISLEEIENLRIERDYQNRIAGKFKP